MEGVVLSLMFGSLIYGRQNSVWPLGVDNAICFGQTYVISRFACCISGFMKRFSTRSHKVAV